jgi:V8-like Glu-specific endopeptidase
MQTGIPDNRFYIGGGSPQTWAAFAKVEFGNYYCSGTLISPDDVLTAAHCVQNSVTGVMYSPHTIIPGQDANAPYGDKEPLGR